MGGRARLAGALGALMVATLGAPLSTGAEAALQQAVTTVASQATADAMEWRPPRMADPLVGQLHELDCASPSFCRADEFFGSVFTGRPGHWSPPRWVGGRLGLDSMTCPTRTFCAALDEDGYWVTNRGSGWSQPERTGADYATEISCISPTFCAAVGLGESTGIASIWDGSSWSDPVSLGQLPIDVSCASRSFCAVTLFLGGASVYDGSTWGPAEPIETEDLQYVTCPIDGFCVAASLSQAVVYEHGEWGAATDVTEPGEDVADVSCMPGGDCLALGVEGTVHMLRDGTWHLSKAIPASGFTDADCPAMDYCVAMKNAGQLYVYDGTAWLRAGSVTDYTHGISSVDCPTETVCMIVDATGAAARFDGRWSRPRQVDGLQRLVAVSCPTAELCFTIASTGRLFRYDAAAGGWTEQEQATLSDPVTSLDCPSEEFCMALDGSGRAASFDGAGWTERGTLAAGGRPLLSCATPEFCGAAVRGVFFSWDGTSWTSLGGQLYSPPGGISCPDEGFCLVTSDRVSTTYRDGRFRSQQAPLDDGEIGVSCVSRSFCLATDTEYHVTTFDGREWSRPTYIGPGKDYPHGWSADLSCAAESVCTVTSELGWSIRSHR